MPTRPIKDIFQDILSSPDPRAAATDQVFKGLASEEKKQLATLGLQFYQGKVRDVLIGEDEIFMVHSDRLSAFDKMIDEVPYKGAILAAISDYWFDYIDGTLPHHSLGLVHERVLKVKKCTPIKAEVIVRNYLAGSMMRAYQDGEREFCGETLPEGLKPYQKLPQPIITPTTKAEVFQHDENTTPALLVEAGVCTEKEWQYIASTALKLFDLGQKRFSEIGWLLVDTKYEFGRDSDGNIVIIDEVHTPDSSRLWRKSTYADNQAKGKAPEMFDKEIVRRYLIENGFSGEGTPPQVPTELLIELASRYLQVTEDLTHVALQSEGPMDGVLAKFII